jgi:cytochrome b
MAQAKSIGVWDWPLRLFHWALVIVIGIAFLSSEEDSALNEWHVLAGWLAAVLVVFRIAWGFVGGEHSRFSDFVRPSRIADHISAMLRGHREPALGHNPLGGLAVLLLLALTAVTVWTGAFGGEPMEDVHELVAWTLLAMVALHVVAVLVMSFLERQNLIRAMITGTKPAAHYPGASDARRPGALALLVAFVVVLGTAYAILRYDPQAFTLRSAESFEHRGDAAVGPHDDRSEPGEAEAEEAR